MLSDAHQQACWLRRTAALALLLAYVASTGEATIGLLRDGSVHHESAISAAVHQETSQGDHGHEDPGVGAEHGDDHQHGTSGDHCTHTHGMGVPAASDFTVFAEIGVAELTATFGASGSFPSFHFRPPKA